MISDKAIFIFKEASVVPSLVPLTRQEELQLEKLAEELQKVLTHAKDRQKQNAR